MKADWGKLHRISRTAALAASLWLLCILVNTVLVRHHVPTIPRTIIQALAGLLIGCGIAELWYRGQL